MKRILSKKSLLIYLLFVICMVLSVFMKKNYHVDEMYSYGLSNYPKGLLLEFEEFQTYERGESPYDWYMTVGEEEKFDYEMVIVNQMKDVHPPFYYILLHSICSLFVGVYSKWFAAVINMFFAVVTLFFLRKIVRLFIKDEKVCNTISLFFVVSPGILNAVVFLRMYVMTMCFMTLFSWILLDNIKKEHCEEGILFYGTIFLTSVVSAMTHYYCIVYVVLLSMVYAAYLLWKKDRKRIYKFSAVMGSSAIVSCLLFPKMMSHIFQGERGAQSINNLYHLSDYPDRVINFFQIISRQLFGGSFSFVIWILLFVGMFFMIIWKVRKQTLDINTFEKVGYGMLIISTVVYYLLISKIAVYVADRYMYPIYALVFIWVTCLVVVVLRKILSVNSWKKVTIGLFVVLTVSGYAGNDGGYFYRDSIPLIEKAKNYQDVDCVILYGEEWTLPSLYPEVSNYKSVTFVSEKNFENLLLSDFWKDQVILSCVGIDNGKYYFDAMEDIPSKNYKGEKIGSFGYSSSYLYIANK